LVDLIDKEILDKKYKETDDEKDYIKEQVKSMKDSAKQNNVSQSYLLKYYGFDSENAFKESLSLNYKRNLAVNDYLKERISDKEMNTYYEDEVFGDIKAKHILIKVNTTNEMTAEEKENADKTAFNKAKDIIKKLDKGENFEDLAKEYSDDKGTAKNGGKLTATYGEVVDEFWNAANELKNKKYTKEPVKTEYGYHIIYRIKGNDKPELKDVEESIKETLAEDALDEDKTLSVNAMIELRKKHKITWHDSELENAYNKYMNYLVNQSKSSN